MNPLNLFSQKYFIFKNLLFCIFLNLILFSCIDSSEKPIYFSVYNPTEILRNSETVSIALSELNEVLNKEKAESIRIKIEDSEEFLLTQLIDEDQNGEFDLIIFQVDLKAGEKKRYSLEFKEGNESPQEEPTKSTYSRYVPERTDDYAWENDRVAFRTYGPEAQRRFENNLPEGTLSSGIDAWLKRVEYPIINKWYKNHLSGGGSYHQDHGEGYDPYHVGSSRGVGGIGVWADDSLFISKNFIAFRTLAVGPIRTIFELDYAPRTVKDIQFSETKRISLDLGSNLYRCEVYMDTQGELPNITIGIALHGNEGEVSASQMEGWFRYWEPMDGSELGLGLVFEPSSVLSYMKQESSFPDGNQLLVMAQPKENKLVYFAGFGWSKSGQFGGLDDWDIYLSDFAKRHQAPLIIEFED